MELRVKTPWNMHYHWTIPSVPFHVFKNNYFLWVGMLCLHVYVCLVPIEVRRGLWIPWNWSYRWQWTNMWVRGIKHVLQKNSLCFQTEPTFREQDRVSLCTLKSCDFDQSGLEFEDLSPELRIKGMGCHAWLPFHIEKVCVWSLCVFSPMEARKGSQTQLHMLVSSYVCSNWIWVFRKSSKCC